MESHSYKQKNGVRQQKSKVGVLQERTQKKWGKRKDVPCPGPLIRKDRRAPGPGDSCPTNTEGAEEKQTDRHQRAHRKPPREAVGVFTDTLAPSAWWLACHTEPLASHSMDTQSELKKRKNVRLHQ